MNRNFVWFFDFRSYVMLFLQFALQFQLSEFDGTKQQYTKQLSGLRICMRLHIHDSLHTTLHTHTDIRKRNMEANSLRNT